MTDTTETTSSANMAAVSPTDESRPSIVLNRSSTPYAGEKLSKAKGNYRQWYEDMLIQLMGNCLFDYIEGDTPTPSATLEPRTHKNWLANDRQAWSIIAGSVDPSERVYIKLESGGATTAKAAWTALKTRHENEGPIRQVNLLQKALAAKCTKEISLPETGRQICEDIKRAFTIGTLNQDLLCCIALMNALEDFPHLRTTVSTNLTDSKAGSYTSENILLLLETEQALRDADSSKRNRNNQIIESTALAAQTKPSKSHNAPTCSVCKRTGHTNTYCVMQGGGMAGKTITESIAARKKDKENKKDGNNSSQTSGKVSVTMRDASGKAFIIQVDPGDVSMPVMASEFVGIASDNIPNHETLAASIEQVEYEGWFALEEEPKTTIDWNTHTKPSDIAAISEISPINQNNRTPISLDDLPFYVDTGATVHISPDKSDFMTLKPTIARSVKGVGGSSITAIGIGSIKLRVARGAYITLQNALYIPNATVRLISVSTLARDNQAVAHFDENSCWITNKSTNAIIARGTLLPNKNLYSLALHSIYAEHVFAAQHAPDLETLHRSLGHANYQTLKDMVGSGMIPGMPKYLLREDPPKCEFCVLGKQTKTPVPKLREEGPGHRATRRLEKIWVDLSGPHVKSRTGNEYMMNIVDDYSSRVWSIPLKGKGDAFADLIAWERARELETGLKVGTYITDNGELKSNNMHDWIASRGTNHLFTAPYTSAHNGRVERMHRTLMAKARTMRIYAKCPPNMWDEFYLTANHLQNKTTTRSLQGTTPWEKWHERKPDYSYMREIGCRVFVLIQNKHNPKIYDRSLECVLIGYDKNSKTYRCYHRETNKVISSYHVRFLESHEGHLPSSPEIPMEATTLESIVKSATSTPIFFDEDEEEFLPLKSEPESKSALQPASDPIPAMEDEPTPPAENSTVKDSIPRRSNRIAEKPVNQGPSRLEKAVQESTEAAARIRIARAERKKTLQDLNEEEARNTPKTVEDAAIEELRQAFGTLNLEDEKAKQIDQVFSAISEMTKIDPSTLEFEDEPKTWEEAQQSVDARRWEEGYRDELKSLKEMGVYKLVPRQDVPQGTKIRKGRPVFRIKRDETGKAVRWKVRLVFKGFEQIYGKDYTKTTSPTARMESWRILLHLAAALDWDAQQIDIKTAFLYGLLPDDEIQYMEQPRGFEEPGKEEHIWRIERGLYGMKQSGRIWNQTMNDQMLSWGFTHLSCESCIYYRNSDSGTIISAVHVDDFLSIASNKMENEKFKDQMRSIWTISDLGAVRFVVGIAVTWDRPNRTVMLSQTALIDKIVTQFGQRNASPAPVPMDPGLKLRRADYKKLSREELDQIAKLPYRSLVGCLLYLSIGTRPDISYSVQQLSQFLDCYTYAHWNAALRVVRYLSGTREYKLHLGGNNPISLLGFTDSDWANCLDTRRSVGGHAYTLGSGVISWQVRKQKTVAASSCEAEYVAAFEACKEAIWLRTLLSAVGHSSKTPTTILCDNNAAINLSEDPLLHDRVKHIDIKHHFLRERVQSNEITLSYINTYDNIADIFTKALDTRKFTRFRGFLGIK